VALVEPLFALEPALPAAGKPTRQSSKAIAPGDIVEIDRKGRRFHAVVEELHQRDSSRFDLVVRPLQRGVTYRTATVAEVVAIWRRG
jgi:hypothetical protein